MARETRSSLAELFGKTVREQRRAQGLSQEELAARCRLHRTYVADIERGSRNPSLQSLDRIAIGLGLALSELFSHLEIKQKGRARKHAD